MRSLGLLSAGVTLALMVAIPVEATHEVDHRYVVLGYVRDATGQPMARTIVRVVRETTGLAYEARTDSEGFYVAVVHLHDEDVLEPLRVTVGGATLRVEARFNPLDPRTPRGTSLDIVAGVARERPEEFAAALDRYVRKRGRNISMGRRSRARAEAKGTGGGRNWFMRRRRWHRRWIAAGIVALLLVAGVGAWQWNGARAAPEAAPRFNLMGSTGSAYRLDDFLGKQEVVLIFYMGAG